MDEHCAVSRETRDSYLRVMVFLFVDVKLIIIITATSCVVLVNFPIGTMIFTLIMQNFSTFTVIVLFIL